MCFFSGTKFRSKFRVFGSKTANLGGKAMKTVGYHQKKYKIVCYRSLVNSYQKWNHIDTIFEHIQEQNGNTCTLKIFRVTSGLKSFRL